jgi:hypothetical protein
MSRPPHPPRLYNSTSKIYSVLAIVYRTQWLCGLCPSCRILNIRKLTDSESESVSILMWQPRATYSAGALKELTSITRTSDWGYLFLRATTVRVSPFLHLRMETDTVSKSLFSNIQNFDDGQSPETQYFWIMIQTKRLWVRILMRLLDFCLT